MIVFPWNSQRSRVFLDRYALKDIDGNALEESPEQMWVRVANAIGGDPKERECFLEILRDFKFVPSGRILAGGRTLYNCFVLGIDSDSRAGIMNVISRMIEVTSRGGGVGINWSILRPRDTYIRGVNGKSSGSVRWMKGGDALADAIRQGGSRTAALMFILDCWHPDVIELTRIGSRFNRANFSISITQAFMNAVDRDEMWKLEFPDTTSPFYDTEWNGDMPKWKSKGLPVIVHQEVEARKLWRAMAEGAHMTGSPGVAFLERCNEMSNTWYFESLVCTNPCAEKPLPVNGCCNLGSINLVAFLDEKSRLIKWDELALCIKYSVRFLDRVIDVSEGIDEAISRTQYISRRIGLGVMGLADVLILSKIRYGSDESCRFMDTLFSFIRDTAYKCSAYLAMEKGVAPGYDRDKFLEGGFIKTLPESVRELIRGNGIRNLEILSQAPTGTVSILAGVSSGIEPVFNKDSVRKDATGESRMTHPLFVGEEADYLVTAHDISMGGHIKVQATLQKYIDAAVSKTINMPRGCTPDQISEAYERAYKAGCKGITIYRQGSLDSVLKPYCESCNE